MKLASVSLHNFRSYRDRVTVKIDDFTTVMGRNDVGKSTVLEALEIFFNQQVVKLDQADPCVHGADKVVEISCIFDEFPNALTLDEQSQTSLEAEYLLNCEGLLEIVKRFDCKGTKPKEEVFARALHPSAAELADLLQLKNTALKERAASVGADLTGVDKRSNVALRAAIRDRVGVGDLEIRLVPLAEDEAKKVWVQLQRELPTFALFQADRASTDDDREVADPMKIAVAAAMKEIEAELEQIKLKVQTSVMDVAQRTLAKLREMDPLLAQQLTPTFKAEPKWDSFKLSLTGDDQIPINKRGSGVRRLILLNFFRAEAERRRAESSTRRVIYAIEEPESSQHPNNQIMLVRALLALAEDPNTQVLMTTHVPAIASLLPTSSIRFISRNDNGHTQVEEGTDAVLEKVADSLGVLPDKRAKVAIFVEGPHDVTFLTNVARVYRSAHADLVDLEDHRIAFVPTGGSTLKQWVDRRYLAHAGMVEVHIYDRDDQVNPKYADAVQKVNARGGADIAFLTSKREMENYLHPDCIVAEYQPDYNIEVTFTDWCDVPAIVAETVHTASGATNWAGLSVEKQGKKSSRAKSRLNNGASARMSIAHLGQTDPGGEILGWLQAVRDRVA
ncbi:ATP-binding protein [Sphingobium vermicomposti]|uniref:ATP-binding protein n=1 Tax=Sphingobium vermicomposti TaxID=529005 RepID=UPI001420877B|nr:ATP-binding protein [Sphingobium vermicomposti]